VASLQETIRSMVIYSVVLLTTTLVLIPVAGMGWVYGTTATVFGVAFVIGTMRLGRDPSEARSMRLFSFSISYVTVLFVAVTLDVFLR